MDLFINVDHYGQTVQIFSPDFVLFSFLVEYQTRKKDFAERKTFFDILSLNVVFVRLF